MTLALAVLLVACSPKQQTETKDMNQLSFTAEQAAWMSAIACDEAKGDLADHGIHKVVSLQPFGCIANHIISKGIERRYKDLYPHLSLLFLDFDAGTSDANITNRLHFLLQ